MITGVNDQKFGFTLGDGHAAEAVKRIVDHPLLTLAGLHCHIGSQITDATLFGEAIRRMVATMADIRARHGVILPELNIGGGHGVPYVSGDPELDPAELSDLIEDALDWACAAERFPRPRIVVEPGRAISARAGVTLYRVIAVKSQAGGRTFVAVDGGMSDNPRVSLYGAKYTVALANRHSLALPRRSPWRGGTVLPRRSPWRGGTAKPAMRSPAMSNCPRTSTPVICWRWRARARITTAWRRTTTWWHGRRLSPCTADEPASWCAVKRWPICSPATADGQTPARATSPGVPPCCTASDRRA